MLVCIDDAEPMALDLGVRDLQSTWHGGVSEYEPVVADRGMHNGQYPGFGVARAQAGPVAGTPTARECPVCFLGASYLDRVCLEPGQELI